MVLFSVVMFPVALLCWALTLPFDRRKVALHRLTCFWASIYTWFNPIWPVQVIGRAKIDPKETYVMVANHQSLLDILVVFRLFSHFKWVSKIENFRIPLVGWNMRLNEYIELKRGDSASIATMLEACRETLDAKDTRKPLLPIVVRGTASALPKKGVIFRGRHEIQIEVLDAIAYDSFADEPTEKLMQRVHTLIGSHLAPETELPSAS
jgi:1-acyl-sn-glycerol-3-phosphate acyltransferase